MRWGVEVSSNKNELKCCTRTSFKDTACDSNPIGYIFVKISEMLVKLL